MRISVCMGIYNGENYIVQQLESIRKQTRVPDEVILCDDGSTDKTRELVREYLDTHTELKGWTFLCNEKNKGYPGNFYHVMQLCTGDIVFLADQDDIWDLQKIETMCDIMEERKNVKVLACTFGLIDEENEEIHTIMSPTAGKKNGKVNPVSIQQVFYKCEWPGMVLVYRNDWYREKMTEHSKIPHDFYVCARAAEEDGFYQLEEILAYHRRHDNNAGGEEHRIRKLLDKNRKLKEIEDYSRILSDLATENVLQTVAGKEALQQKMISMKGRYEALKTGKISKVLKNALHYKKQVRMKTVVCDVLIVRQKR